MTAKENAIFNVTTSDSKSDFVRADAFLNIKLKASEGKAYRIGNTGQALYAKNVADKVLIDRYSANPELVSELDTKLLEFSFVLLNGEPAAAPVFNF